MIILFFLGLFLLLAGCEAYFSRHWRRGLTVTLGFTADYAYQGGRAQLIERIENHKKMMLPILEVSFHADRGLSFPGCENTRVSDYVYKRDIFSLLGMQRVIRRLDVDCAARGYYSIDESWVGARSPLTGRQYSAGCGVKAGIYVYAARTGVSDIAADCERLMGSLQCARRLYEDPFAASAIREYMPSDPMKTINWKASAKTGGLMVNTYESTVSEKAVIYLDLEDAMILKYEHLMEASISIAASLAQRLIGRGMEVGLCASICTAAGPGAAREIRNIFFEPAGGSRQLDRIERALARHRTEGGSEPFEKVLSGAASDGAGQASGIGRGAAGAPQNDLALIFISKNAQRNIGAIESFAAGRPSILVVPYEKNTECPVRQRGNVRIICREVARI